MHRTTRLSLMAAALSCTMSTPLLAQDVTLPADELAAMRAQLAAMNARIKKDTKFDLEVVEKPLFTTGFPVLSLARAK